MAIYRILECDSFAGVRTHDAILRRRQIHMAKIVAGVDWKLETAKVQVEMYQEEEVDEDEDGDHV